MIRTYFIAGYAIEEPYLGESSRKKVKNNPEIYEGISKKIKLVLFNEDRMLLKEVAKMRYGELYRKRCRKIKRTNWYKFIHAVFRLKDSVKIVLFDKKFPELFVGQYISYNTVTKKWVYTNEKLRKPIRLPQLVKEYISFNLSTKFFMLPEVFDDLNGQNLVE